MDTKTAINGGKELAALIIQYCAKDAGGNKNLQKYIDDMNSGNGVFKEQKEALKILSDAGTEMEDGAHALLDNFSRNTGDMEKVFTSFDGFAKDVRGVADANKTTTKQLEQLSDQIKAITKHTDEINDISEQTNLLSFNASIEAARAGQAGKGFRIIANEVKRLSDTTKTNSQTIGSNISSLNEELQNLLKENNSCTQMIHQLKTSAATCKTTMSGIAEDNTASAETTQKVVSKITANNQNVISISEKVEKENIAQIQQIADRASENSIQLSDRVSLMLELKELFAYLAKTQATV